MPTNIFDLSATQRLYKQSQHLLMPFATRSTMLTSLGLVTILLLAACLPWGKTDLPQRITYKQVDGVTLRLHAFYPPGHTTQHKRPAILLFSGGGFTTCMPKQMYPYCRHLARQGMVCFSAEYRVLDTHGVKPYIAVQDAKSAIRWLRKHAPELGIDPKRIAAGGASSGGHIATASVLLKYQEPGEDTRIPPTPDALILFNPVFDNGPPNGFGYNAIKDYWQDFSPLHNIHPNTQAPPTLIMTGTEDHLLPIASAKTYQQKMQQAGNHCQLSIYQGQGHGFFNTKNHENHQRTLTDIDQFLHALGYLETNNPNN